MSYVLTLDFETVDPTLASTGSCYRWDPNFMIVGMGYAIDDGEVLYTTDTVEMTKLIEDAHTLVAHNITYELGCIKYLGMLRGDYINFKYKKIRCTRIGSILDYNIRQSHSLAYLGKELVGIEKSQDTLGQWVLDNGHVTYPKKYYGPKSDAEYRAKTEATYLRKAIAWSYSNLDKLPDDIVKDYCINDVLITRELDKIFLGRISVKDYHFWSDMCKVTVEMRHRGVRFDVAAAVKAEEMFNNKLKAIERILQSKGWWVNLNSSKQKVELFTSLGVELPTNANGNKSCDKEFLSKCSHPAAKLIIDWMKYRKAMKDFCIKLREMSVNGRIHGEMKLFGALATGRFSHKNPNLAQIPSRDKEISPICRALFTADEGERWFSLDFSAQEPRFYVHLAVEHNKSKVEYKAQTYNIHQKTWEWNDYYSKFDCPMIEDLQQKYKEKPDLDSHDFNRQLIQDTTGIVITRTATKTFALGKAYGKGIKSTAEQLEITYDQALKFYKAFNKAAPYITLGFDYYKYLFTKKDGYVTTVLGRKNYWNKRPMEAKNGFNYAVQGSGLDQTASAMLKAYYDLGIVPTTVAHDEINFSGTREQAEQLKHIMENVIKLNIPSLAEIGEGDNWKEAK